MDIFVFSLLIVSAVHGAKKGFAASMRSFLQWFICIIAGFMLFTPVKSYIISNTEIAPAIEDIFSSSVNVSSLKDFVPDACAKWFNPVITSLENEISTSFTSLILTIISFLLVILVVKVLFYIFTRIFSKKYHDGVTGFIDGTIGLLFGLGRGIIFLLLMFMLFIPVFSMCFPDAGTYINDALENSIFANVLYNDNILLTIISLISL